jgi:hypothetical protein|tara:strand:- start:1357 stop:1869 length:513 start_codon:yes stop_codon:yes gene_type:complete
MEMKNIKKRLKLAQEAMTANEIENIVLKTMITEALQSKTEEQANNYWRGITGYCKTLPREQNPIQGNATTPPVAQMTINGELTEVYAASVDLYRRIGHVLEKRGGGQFVANDKDVEKQGEHHFATMMSNQVSRNMKGWLSDKSHPFDGKKETVPTLLDVEIVEEVVEATE